MEDIKVGEYVRLARCQGINKIIEIDEETDDLVLDKEIADEWGDETCYIPPEDIEDEIFNHSLDILDLIERGDFVNDYKILDLNKKEDRIMICIAKIGVTEHWITLDRVDIKDIVTKEQFEREKYVVGG